MYMYWKGKRIYNRKIRKWDLNYEER